MMTAMDVEPPFITAPDCADCGHTMVHHDPGGCTDCDCPRERIEPPFITRCERGNWKGLDNAPEVCECEHEIATYQARVGVRCRCCAGRVDA